jgi:hypothetical protein
MKPFVPDNTEVLTDLPVHIQLDTKELEWQLCKKGNASHAQTNIKWSSLPAIQTTWEDYDVLWARFPNAPTWGQTGPPGGGGVKAGSSVSDELQ